VYVLVSAFAIPEKRTYTYASKTLFSDRIMKVGAQGIKDRRPEQLL